MASRNRKFGAALCCVVALLGGCTVRGTQRSPAPTGSPLASASLDQTAHPTGTGRAPGTIPARPAPSSSTLASPRPWRPSRHRAARPVWASGAGAPPFPVPSGVDQHSVDAVALAGAAALASVDTAVDPVPQQTAVRAAAAGWLTPGYARRVRDAQIIGPAGAIWDSWFRHRAYLTVTATPSGEDHPPDTALYAARKVVLREHAVGRDGWRARTSTVVVAVVVEKVNNVWRIASDTPS
jgi:hypothetical protein